MLILCALLTTGLSGALEAQTAGLSPVFRFYNAHTAAHFYTISTAERDSVRASYPQLVYEGAGFSAYTGANGSAKPVFRFYNVQTGSHFYTISEGEKTYLQQRYPQILLYEGAAYYAQQVAADDGRVALYRFYNTATSAHFYTTSVTERDQTILNPQFIYEGVAYYVYASPAFSSDSFRFLNQSSFGPTPATVARVLSIGVAAYIEQQFALPISGYPAKDFYYLSLDESPNCRFDAPDTTSMYACARDQLTLFKLRNQFFTNALNQPDQLRQRVAWALSQFFVISGTKDPDLETAYVQARYQQMLAEEAFGNFEDLLLRVTLSAQMGHYLDMVDNAKADPAAGTEPNENFARELLQLFSIGLVELGTDGTALTDSSGRPIPTFGQAEIKAFARVLTGWTYPPFDAAQEKGSDDDRFYAHPMVPVPEAHDTDAKHLLNGYVIAAGQPPEPDLRAALHNVFLHPNVGPFVGTHLIRQLVTSNPTPAYVARVAGAFNNNGSGVRGDMKAVLRAILLDPEARGDGKADSRYGQLKEPVLFITSLLRQLPATSDGVGLVDPSAAMGQDVFYSPSVFNYYPAQFRIPGTTLAAPQFGIHNTNTVLARLSFVYDLLYNGGIERDPMLPGSLGTQVDTTLFETASADPESLVALINGRLFGGGMTSGMREELVAAVSALPAEDPAARARAALFLAATSFQFQVNR